MDDSYIKESCKSFQKCHVANSARRNSLAKKTIGIEFERKLASHQLDREERQLREHLRTMMCEQAKSPAVQSNKDKTDSEPLQRKSHVPQVHEPEDNEFIDPYPVTFASIGSASPSHRQRSNTIDEKAGRMYAARRERRVSKEFEDLCVNTTTGKLAIPAHLWLHPLMLLTTVTTPPLCSPHRKSCSSRSSMESADAVIWQGEPEAIHSVRRARKSVEQQDKERITRMIGDLCNK